MYNPQELQRKAQLNIHGVDTNAQTSLVTNNSPKQENNKSVLATVGNVVSNLVEGAVKSIEGIVDAGAMLVGLFGADVDEFVSYDITSDIFGTDEEGEGLLEWSWGRNLADASYLDNDNIVNQIAEGVGGMLPAIALQFVPGVGQVLSTGMFIGSAAGNASESALQEGATYGQALGYGATAGAIEGVTEMIGGRAIGKATELTDTMLGKFLIRKGWDKTVSKGVGKMAYSFASEGLEEVISDLADPVNKYAWGINDTLEMPTLKDLVKTFVVGGSVGAVLDSFSKGASAIKNHKIGGKSFVKVAENLEDISNTNKALAYLQQHKGITQDRLNNATIRSSERTMDSIEKISEELQSMTDEKRKLAFDTLRKNTSFVDDTFNTDGTIKEEVRNDYAEVMNKGAIYNVSTDLVYKGKALENEIKAVNEEHKMNLELSDTAFTENQRKSFAKINRSVAKLNEKVGERISIVAIKENPDANAFINKNTIFINEKYLEDGTWAKYLSHEVSHFARKSKEFNSFAEYITSNDDVLTNSVLKVDGVYKYDFDLNTAKKVINKVQKGEQVSKKESDFYDEVVAHITEDLFINEKSINRLVKNDSSLAQKILKRIKQFLQIFNGTNADSKTVIDLRKAEMLFEKALSSIGKENKEFNEKYEKSINENKKAKEKFNSLSEEQRESWLKKNDWNAEDFADDVLDDGNELDNSGEIRYSIKENLQGIYIEDKQEYAKLSQALASKNGNKPKKVEYVFTDNNFYVVKDNRLGHFTPVLQVEIVGNEKLIDSIKENIKNGSHRKATTIAEWAGIVQSGTRSDNRDNGSITRRETNGYANELYGEESESNARRNTSQNSRNSKKVARYDFENRIVTYKDGTTAKFSLKDSDGNELYNSSEIYSKEKIDIDEDFQKYYNPRIKNLLSNKEWHFWYSERSAYLKGANFVKIDNNILIPVGPSKVVLTDIAFDNPYAKDVFITTEYFDGDAQGLIDYIDEGVTKYGYSIQEIWKLATNVYGETLFNIHNGATGLDSESINKWESSNRQNDRTLQGNEDGNGASKGSSKTDKKISFSLKEWGNPTSNPDIRFSLKDKADIKQYSEKQYNDFGWARVNGVLSANENYDFKKKYLEIKNGTNKDIHKTANGEYIVAVNDMEGKSFAVNNVLVYAKGPHDNYKINKVVRLLSKNETHLDIIRKFIYEYEQDRNAQTRYVLEDLYGEEIVGQYSNADFPDYRTLKERERTSRSRNDGGENNSDNQREFNGRGDFEENQRTIKFSLKDGATYALSDGQVKKKVANFTKLKVYSKVEAERVINSILDSNLGFEDYDISISGKNKAEVIDVLWKTLNTADSGKRTGISLKIADYIIDNAVMENIYHEDENDIHLETIKYLKPYLHKVDLRGLKSEIKYRYDTDNSVYLLWGSRKGEVGQSADQIAMELAESGFFIDAENEADIFFEMDRAYREAVRALKKKSDKFLADTLGKEERDKLRQDIAKDILRAFDSSGKKSKLAEIIEQQKERAKVWKDLYYEEKQRNSAINNLLYEVGKIRDIHFGDFQNSTQSHNLLFRGSIERLSAIKHRGDLNKSGTRSIVAGLNEWYSKDNPVVGDRFIEDISYILNKISSGTGKLTAEEIKGLATAVAYFKHFIETSNKIFRAGKYVDAKPIVEDYIKKIAETQNLKISWAGKVFDKLFNNSKLNYMQTFNDPMTIARYMDKYGDGFFTQTLESFREGAVNSAILEMELNASVEEFYDKHKKFLKNLKAKTVKYNNVEIPADKALYLYMALNREQALMGLARSGFSYKDDKGKTVRVAGFETNEDLTLDDIKIIASEVQSELEKQFTEEEIEYIKIAEKLFNEDCKKLKSERDKTRLGYSNVVDDYYIPIRRAYIAQSVDVDSLQFELDRVSNLSFNKSAVKGAENELFIESLDLVLSRHLRGIAQYYHLSNVIDNFYIIYNMDIGGNANRVKSIASESANVWDKGKTYLQDLISDIQGIKRGEGSRAVGWIRGSYAKYQLGANPKVWFTQLSSFFASTSILDYGSVIKGLAIKTNDVDKYCSLAKLRNNDNIAALAQGVLDKVDKVSNVLMKPIGMTDRLVVKKLFGACQVQVQKNTGLKIGTEENKVKAGELLQKVILETQQNTMATERSQAMRSSSELMKTLTMFTSDSMKVVGRVIDSYGELSILKARRKATTDASKKANLDKQIKAERIKAAKSTSALVTSAIFMALIAQAFRTLYNKDDEEDNIVENMTVDAVGNLFGGLPIFKDVYAKLVEGYDFDGYQYSAINDLLDSMSDVINLTGDIFSGNADSRDIALNIKKMSYAIGQLFGIPVRNVYNVFYGLTNRISPATAYKIDDIFYKQSYNSDLKKAIKNNDEAMIATIAGLIMNENVGDFENGLTRSELNRLLSAGFDVLPQSVPSSVTINEVQHSLTGPQQEKFRKAYSGAITSVDKLVSSNGYKIATDEAKAKAIKYVYRYYYYEAQHQALNVDLDSKLYLFGPIVPIEKMALALAEVPLLVENSTNKKTAVQRYLQASKLTSAQKYMLMGYFGYKNTKGEGVVKSAINKTSLTKEQKKLLLEKCGY